MHELEINNGIVSMAYAGDTPWHSLGKKVPHDLSPEQMLIAAELNWEVEKIPGYATVAGKQISMGKSALIRKSDNKILDIVSDDWNPVQNKDAFEFFDEFVKAGDMEMNTAGSLKGGSVVWGLAEVKESFELFKGDVIKAYLLFTNFHKYGFSTDVRFTPTRVVCNNTLTLALNNNVERMVKFSHRREFKPEQVKEMLGIATDKLLKYKEMAAFLGSKKAKNEDVVEYFKRVYPLTGPKVTEEDRKLKTSRNAELAMGILNTQPGAQFAQGTWWTAFNSVTYIVDHLASNNDNNRMYSACYGNGKTTKTKALELALEYSQAA